MTAFGRTQHRLFVHAAPASERNGAWPETGGAISVSLHFVGHDEVDIGTSDSASVPVTDELYSRVFCPVNMESYAKLN